MKNTENNQKLEEAHSLISELRAQFLYEQLVNNGLTIEEEEFKALLIVFGFAELYDPPKEYALTFEPEDNIVMSPEQSLVMRTILDILEDELTNDDDDDDDDDEPLSDEDLERLR